MRPSIKAQYSASRSTMIQRRPVRWATAPVVPVPAKGSSTRSPSRLVASSTRSSRASGFWVLCSLRPLASRRRSAPLQMGRYQSLRICLPPLSSLRAR